MLEKPTDPPFGPALPADLGSLDQFIEEEEAARLVGRAIATLRHWRVNRRHLPFYRHAGTVRYKRHDVLGFLEAGRVEVAPSDREP